MIISSQNYYRYILYWLAFPLVALSLSMPLTTKVAACDSVYWSEYVSMPDGVKLAVDVWLPKSFKAGDKLPTIIYATRYWRSKAYANQEQTPNEAIKIFNAAGYAFISIDVRGTGASFGNRKGEFTVAETNDLYHLIDWIIKQPWSNQKVAATGVSYTANTAENSSFTLHPALKAISPRFSDFDWYTSLVFPGGIPNKIISGAWGEYVWALDMNDPSIFTPAGGSEHKILGVNPVSTNNGIELLKHAVAEHALNARVSDTLAKVTFRDDLPEASNLEAPRHFVVTPYRFKSFAEKSDAAVFHWGSWMDSGTAAGVLARFVDYDVRGKFIIGPWNHGAYKDANLFSEKDIAVAPSRWQQYHDISDFFTTHLNDNSPETPVKKELLYFTMGENVWKTTNVWPPQDTTFKTLYLSDKHKLTARVPESSEAYDTYTVNFEAGTGKETRWSTQLGGTDVYYGDRAKANELLLTYTSAPLPSAIEITGTPVVKLEVASTHSDGAIIAYLEVVSPSGEVIMITEGGLRLIHRKTSEHKREYETFGPYHSFLREDAKPMLPGVIDSIHFSLLPTSVKIPKGYAIRLSIAGHDKDTFVRIPESGTPSLQVHRSARKTSFITLPVIKTN